MENASICATTGEGGLDTWAQHGQSCNQGRASCHWWYGGETLDRWNMVTVQHDIGWLREQNGFWPTTYGQHFQPTISQPTISQSQIRHTVMWRRSGRISMLHLACLVPFSKNWMKSSTLGPWGIVNFIQILLWNQNQRKRKPGSCCFCSSSSALLACTDQAARLRCGLIKWSYDLTWSTEVAQKSTNIGGVQGLNGGAQSGTGDVESLKRAHGATVGIL